MLLFSAVYAVALFASVGLAAPGPSSLYRRALPISIDPSTAATYVNELAVGDPSNSPPYSRSLFHTWDTINGTCNTREEVLKRDGTGVQVGADCYPTSGHWVSPYDDVSVDVPSQLDIDHVVPLKEAWISGARDWTDKQRESFANDLTRPQLAAVTAHTNRQKSDSDPAQWLPPVDSFKCDYVLAYIEVKHYYKLTVDSAEKSALSDILSTYC